MSIWRASRPRLAPKAERMANSLSLSRAAARAMSRLSITFAQAIRRTASTALNKIHATNRTSCIGDHEAIAPEDARPCERPAESG